MNNMINYDDFLEELKDYIAEGMLSEKDHVQILRAKEAFYADYYPIIDWYFDEASMKEDMETPLEEMYLKEEFTEEEWQEMIEEQKAFHKQYEEDKADLTDISVKNFMTEMKQMKKLFK